MSSGFGWLYQWFRKEISDSQLHVLCWCKFVTFNTFHDCLPKLLSSMSVSYHHTFTLYLLSATLYAWRSLLLFSTTRTTAWINSLLGRYPKYSKLGTCTLTRLDTVSCFRLRRMDLVVLEVQQEMGNHQPTNNYIANRGTISRTNNLNTNRGTISRTNDLKTNRGTISRTKFIKTNKRTISWTNDIETNNSSN